MKKVLIANRGEIAVRIIRACRELGLHTVAVYSEADRSALHAKIADEAVCIGPAKTADSYLNVRAIIAACEVTGADAIHPGFGFLSENASFARTCEKCGITFIGPDSRSIEMLGDKAAAKQSMKDAGVPVIPGSDGAVKDMPEAIRISEEMGYPVMVKASAGGGGRGIRLIRSEDEFEDAWHQAAGEALSAFGDGSLYLEKYIFPARHVELQILADEHGNAVCLGDRDCSLQRRNQKLLEETPSPAVNEAQREKIMALAVDAVKKIGYIGAGTLEFLLDQEGNFWFMEMNVRLQVEHCVTEMLTGVDLVKWQIRIAAGIPLNFSQKDVRMQGSTIECRINAAACGTLKMLHVPGGPSVRFDTCLVAGTVVTPYYDSLLGKLIVYAKTREETLRKMRAALCELVIDGIPTNIKEQLRIVEDERFTSGDYDLTFMGNR
jgi:acetyl-CoA carboxylase biotin carboxylase subunit